MTISAEFLDLLIAVGKALIVLLVVVGLGSFMSFIAPIVLAPAGSSSSLPT
jgi:hypothetical protein